MRRRYVLWVTAALSCVVVAWSIVQVLVTRQQLDMERAAFATTAAELLDQVDSAATAQVRLISTLTAVQARAADNLRAARDSQALFTADLSRQQMEAGYSQNALLLANESLAHYDDGIYHPESMIALMHALDAPVQEIARVAHAEQMAGVASNLQETQFVAWSVDGLASVIDALTGDVLFQVQHADWIRGARWNPDGTRLLTWSLDGSARLSDAATGETLLIVSYAGGLSSASFNADATLLLTWGWGADNEYSTQVSDAVTGDTVLTLQHDRAVFGARWSDDEKTIYSFTGTEARISDAASGETLRSIPLDPFAQDHILSPDESRLLVRSHEAPARIIDITTGRTLLTLPEPDSLMTPAWHPDGSSLLLRWRAGFDVAVIDAASGDALLTLPPHEGRMQSALWNADATRLVTWSGATLRIILTDTGRVVLDKRFNQDIYRVQWIADETSLLVTFSDGSACRVAPDDGAVAWCIRHRDYTVRFRMTADATRLVSWDSLARLWALDSARTSGAAPIIDHREPVIGAAWNTAGTRVLTWGRDGSARITDAASGDTLLTVQHASWVLGAAWSADEMRLLTWSYQQARVTDTATGETEFEINLPPYATIIEAIWHDGSALLLTSAQNELKLVDAATGDTRLTVAHGDPIRGAVWNASRTQIASWSTDHGVIVTDIRSGERVALIQHDDAVNGVTWNPAETRLLTWSADGGASVTDLATGAALLTIGHDDAIRDARWSMDGTHVLTCSEDGTARITVIASGQTVRVFRPEGDRIELARCLWNADETRLLTVTYAGRTDIWDTATGDALLQIPDAQQASWNADDSRLLVRSRAFSARVLDADTGAELLRLPHENTLWGTAWNADETRLLTWSVDGTARVWSVDLRYYIALGRQRAIHTFTPAERARFFLPPANSGASLP